jgi:hypothetical protein
MLIYSISNSMNMYTLTFSVNATTVATLTMMLAITASTLTKRASVLEDPKYCNTDKAPLVTIRIRSPTVDKAEM